MEIYDLGYLPEGVVPEVGDVIQHEEIRYTYVPIFRSEPDEAARNLADEWIKELRKEGIETGVVVARGKAVNQETVLTVHLKITSLPPPEEVEPEVLHASIVHALWAAVAVLGGIAAVIFASGYLVGESNKLLKTTGGRIAVGALGLVALGGLVYLLRGGRIPMPGGAVA